MKLARALGVAAAAASSSWRSASAAPAGPKYALPDEPDCVGPALGPGQRLEPGQYICDDSAGSGAGAGVGPRFGMDRSGVPVLHDRTGRGVWAAAGRGTLLRFNPIDSAVELWDGSRLEWRSGCLGRGGADRIVLEDGGVKAYDLDGSAVWGLDARGDLLGCYSEVPEEVANRAPPADSGDLTVRSPFVCVGRSLRPGGNLTAREFICDPSSINRFGLSASGSPHLYWNGRLKWRVDSFGDALLFSEEQAELSLQHSPWRKKPWSTLCGGENSTGKMVRVTPHGIIILDSANDTIWHLTPDGEVESACPSEDLIEEDGILPGV